MRNEPAPSRNPAPAFALSLVLFAPVAAIALPPSNVVAVLGPPAAGTPGAARIVAGAGGAILRVGRWPNLLVAISSEAGFARRLYAAGAWLVVDPAILTGCDPLSPPTSRHPAEDKLSQ
jgi:hypothetical protein